MRNKNVPFSRRAWWSTPLLCGALLLGCGLCQAKLDGDRASVLADQTAWGATSSQAPVGSATGASVYTQTLGNGVTVRQYVDAAGTVFGVAWEGPVMPDFERLLGNHFASFTDAQRQQKRGVHVQTSDLVIESGGMMRSFAGRAYLPAKLPATVSPQDIR